MATPEQQDRLQRALDADKGVRAEQEQWRRRQQQLLADRAEAFRAALEAGVTGRELASQLGMSTTSMYRLIKKGEDAEAE